MGALTSGSVACGAALLAYAVRSRSSQILAPSHYRGPRDRRAVALTFDDGPSESTPELLEVLRAYDAPATFFQCGANIRRLPDVARHVAASGHEIGNHSDTHRALYLRPSELILTEFQAAQRTIQEKIGVRARHLRAPFGVRWFGFRAMQRRLGLRGVMWTVIGRDWVLDAAAVSRRVLSAAANGSIVCLHDGRELTPRPDIRITVEAVRRIIPELLARGYRLSTVSDLLCPTN